MKFVLIFIWIVNLNSAYALQVFNMKAKEGQVEFLAKGTLLKINGKGKGVEGNVVVDNDIANGELILDLDSLKTGINLRDEHMKNKYLHLKEYPNAILNIENMPVPNNFKGKSNFNGTLLLHGIKKPVSGVVDLKGIKDGKLHIYAEFDIKISNFNIDLPSFKGITLTEDVKIKVQSKAYEAEDLTAKKSTTSKKEI